MSDYIKKFYKIETNFLEKLIFLSFFILLILLIMGISFVFLNIYYIFLNLLPLAILIISINFIFIFIVNQENIKIDMQRNKLIYLVIIILILFSIFNFNFFYEIKIEGGHDQGAYLENAIYLAKNTNISFDNINVISYPGFWIFKDNKILSQFLPGYSIFLSMFYYLFGFKGFAIANAFLLFFGFSFLFFLSKNIKNEKAGLLLLSFLVLNYYTIYFSRATYIENLQLPLIWSSVYMFMIGYDQKKLDWIIYGCIPISLLLLVRYEGFLYLTIYLSLLFYFKFFKKWSTSNRCNRYVRFALFLNLCVLFLYILYVYSFNPSIISNVVGDYLYLIISNPTNTLTEYPLPYNEQLFIWSYIFYVFFQTGIILMAFLGVTNLLNDTEQVRNKIIIVTVLIFPQLAFLIKPSIALYLPWFMRRFWSVLLPYIFLIFALFLANKNFHFKRLKYVIISIIFIITLTQSAPILAFSNGKGILDFEKKISFSFDKNDLVIFWDRYKYENFGPPLYFMYDVNVVFDRDPAFVPELYAVFMKDFRDIYIVTSRNPNDSLIHPYFSNDNLEFIKTLKSDNIKVIKDGNCDVRDLLIYPETFKGYYQIQEKCSLNNPPIEIADYNIELNIYKIKNANEFISKYYNNTYLKSLYILDNKYENKYTINME